MTDTPRIPPPCRPYVARSLPPRPLRSCRSGPSIPCHPHSATCASHAPTLSATTMPPRAARCLLAQPTKSSPPARGRVRPEVAVPLSAASVAGTVLLCAWKRQSRIAGRGGDFRPSQRLTPRSGSCSSAKAVATAPQCQRSSSARCPCCQCSGPLRRMDWPRSRLSRAIRTAVARGAAACVCGEAVTPARVPHRETSATNCGRPFARP